MDLRFLFVSANPSDDEGKRVYADHEYREIKDALRRGNNKITFEEPLFAAQLTDVVRALHHSKPNIVHFCGHANEEGLGVLKKNGRLEILSSELLEELLDPHRRRLRLVYLNACSTAYIANTLKEYSSYTIGMHGKIREDIAVQFAVEFYPLLVLHKEIRIRGAFDETREKFLAYSSENEAIAEHAKNIFLYAKELVPPLDDDDARAASTFRPTRTVNEFSIQDIVGTDYRFPVSLMRKLKEPPYSDAVAFAMLWKKVHKESEKLLSSYQGFHHSVLRCSEVEDEDASTRLQRAAITTDLGRFRDVLSEFERFILGLPQEMSIDPLLTCVAHIETCSDLMWEFICPPAKAFKDGELLSCKVHDWIFDILRFADLKIEEYFLQTTG